MNNKDTKNEIKDTGANANANANVEIKDITKDIEIKVITQNVPKDLLIKQLQNTKTETYTDTESDTYSYTSTCSTCQTNSTYDHL
jgi:hypothetical protein